MGCNILKKNTKIGTNKIATIWIVIERCAAFLAHLAAIGIFIITAREIVPWLTDVRDTVAFQISYPLNGDEVGPQTLVAGTAPVTERKIYVLVRTPAHVEWVQSGQATTSSDGQWSATAKIGEGTVGCGEDFLLRAVLVEEPLKPGVLLGSLPRSAILSNEVAVSRTIECGD